MNLPQALHTLFARMASNKSNALFVRSIDLLACCFRVEVISVVVVVVRAIAYTTTQAAARGVLIIVYSECWSEFHFYCSSFFFRSVDGVISFRTGCSGMCVHYNVVWQRLIKCIADKGWQRSQGGPLLPMPAQAKKRDKQRSGDAADVNLVAHTHTRLTHFILICLRETRTYRHEKGKNVTMHAWSPKVYHSLFVCLQINKGINVFFFIRDVCCSQKSNNKIKMIQYFSRFHSIANCWIYRFVYSEYFITN